MKPTVLLTGALLLAGAGSAMAQRVAVPNRAGDDAAAGRTQASTWAPPVAPTPIGPASLSAVGYTVIDSLANAFSFYTYGAEPIMYEPLTNTLVLIKRGNPTQTGNEIFIRVSPDLGATWGPALGPLHNSANDGAGRYPAVFPLNLTGTTNRDELYYYFTFPTLALNNAFGAYVTGLIDAAGTPLVPAVRDNGANSGAYTWGTDAHTAIAMDKSALVTVGSVSGNRLAVRRFDPQQGSVTSFVPAQWDSINFVPSSDPASRTSTFSGLDMDNAGMMYAGIFARFPSLEADTSDAFPAPAISTSSDNGATWSAMDIMPRTLLTNYITSLGGNPDSARFGYSTNDFIVTGPGQASFLLNLSEINADRGNDQIRQVVEVYRDGANWNIRQVGSQNGWLLFDNGDGDTSSQVENEIQVSKTVDGNTLLAKWTEVFTYTFESDINDDGISPDTLTTTDIVVALRKPSETAWGPTTNVTETSMLDRQGWIPPVIPNDLTNVPMITIQSKLDPSVDTKISDSLVDAQRILVDREQYVVSANFDATAAVNGVRGPVATASFRLNAPMPNPSRDRSLVTFNLHKAGHVTIDVYAASGQKVKTILDEAREEGNFGVAMNTADLANGTYYYTMRVNGEALTQSFTVMH